MAKKKIKFTRLELKRQRDLLARYERYLPMLKLKQQQLQLAIRKIEREKKRAQQAVQEAQEAFDRYSSVLFDMAGVNVKELGECEEVKKKIINVAGIYIPVFEGVTFREARYSLFGTPPWVDQAIRDLREISKRKAELEIIEEQHKALSRELTRVIQRVNLFEKVKIPEIKENIRIIRIYLGDEMTAAVGRAKIAKARLAAEREAAQYRMEATAK